MTNSEPTCSPHEDGCKEALIKLQKCVLAQLASKEEFNDEEGKFSDFMKGGACKESYTTFVESTDKADDKYMTMMECMEAHSDYYDTFLDFYKGGQEKVMKEFKSINPSRRGDGEFFIRVQEFLGECCKEQYSALLRCYMK